MEWDLLDTPNPNEDALRVWVDDGLAKVLRGQYASGVTTLKAFSSAGGPGVEGYEDFVYVGKLGKEDTRRGFVFALNSTTARGTPYETYTEQGNHYWHPVLKKVSFFQDPNFPVSTNGADGGIVIASRLYNRHIYVPGVSEGTLFQFDLFYAAAKFAIGQTPVPVPTAVSWDYHDSQGSFQECLHPRLVFPAMRTATASYTTGGGTVGASGSSPGQIFPATNFEDRQSYVLYDKQKRQETGWWRERVTVFPPDEPDAIKK